MLSVLFYMAIVLGLPGELLVALGAFQQAQQMLVPAMILKGSVGCKAFAGGTLRLILITEGAQLHRP